jgi:hypothetical protein
VKKVMIPLREFSITAIRGKAARHAILASGLEALCLVALLYRPSFMKQTFVVEWAGKACQESVTSTICPSAKYGLGVSCA